MRRWLRSELGWPARLGGLCYLLWGILHVVAGCTLLVSARGDINGHLAEMSTGGAGAAGSLTAAGAAGTVGVAGGSPAAQSSQVLPADDSGGCGCRVEARDDGARWASLGGLGLLLAAAFARRR